MKVHVQLSKPDASGQPGAVLPAQPQAQVRLWSAQPLQLPLHWAWALTHATFTVAVLEPCNHVLGHPNECKAGNQ
jgi:hypothetical protein